MLAQTYTVYEEWLGRHVYQIAFTAVEVGGWEKEALQEQGRSITPRITEHQEVEQTAAMVDRWQKAYLRTIRALRDLRRHVPMVIQNAGQTNVGERQINVAALERSDANG